MPDASPVKWHLAHTSWFFETFLLERFLPGYTPFDPSFRVLFNSYYNGVGDKHPRSERGLLSRPDLARVRAYRAHVEASMAPLLRDPPAEAAALIELGLQHEQQHQELILTDLKHLLLAQSRATGVSPAMAAGAGQPAATSMVASRRGARSARPRRCRLRFRQRDAAPRGFRASIRARVAARHQRRIRGVHRRRRLSTAGAVALARLGHGHRARLERAAVLGARRDRRGAPSRFTAWPTSTRIRRCAT